MTPPIRLGDIVLATDPTTGRNTPQPVVATIIGTGSKNLVTLTIDTDGPTGDATGTVTATDHHRFHASRGWTSADDLEPGDRVTTPTGGTSLVLGIRHHRAATTVHNLTIGVVHTYNVVVGGTATLVHNELPCRESYWPGGNASSACQIADSNGCENVALAIQRELGGQRIRIEPPARGTLGPYRGQDTGWYHHEAVLKDGRVYDAFTGPQGELYDDYLAQFDYSGVFNVKKLD